LPQFEDYGNEQQGCTDNPPYTYTGANLNVRTASVYQKNLRLIIIISFIKGLRLSHWWVWRWQRDLAWRRYLPETTNVLYQLILFCASRYTSRLDGGQSNKKRELANA
jgi:hypothetical protein